MFASKWIFGLVGAEEALCLRRRVNVGAFGVPEAEEFDWFDGVAAHLVVKEGDEVLAVGRIYPDGDLTRIDRITAAPEHAQEPYGDLVLRVLLDKARDLAAPTVAVCVKEEETAYYARFGFRAVSAPIAMRDGRYVNMTVPRESILLPSDCGHTH